MDGSRLDIVCSAGSRAGKTTFARFLADFSLLADSAEPPRLFDTAVPDGDLERRYPTDCELLDIRKTQAQLRMLDPLVDPTITQRHHIIDLADGARDRFVSIAETTAFDAEAADWGTRIFIWHLMEPDAASLRSLQRFRAVFPSAHLIAVRGPAMQEAARLAWSRIDLEDVPVQTQVNVPFFTRGTANTIHDAGFSFADFISDSGRAVHPVIRDELMGALSALRDEIVAVVSIP